MGKWVPVIRYGQVKKNFMNINNFLYTTSLVLKFKTSNEIKKCQSVYVDILNLTHLQPHHSSVYGLTPFLSSPAPPPHTYHPLLTTLSLLSSYHISPPTSIWPLPSTHEQWKSLITNTHLFFPVKTERKSRLERRTPLKELFERQPLSF